MNSQTTCKRDSKRNITERKRTMGKTARTIGIIGIITMALAITVGLASCTDTGRKEEPKNGGAYERPRTGTSTGLPANAEVLDIDWPSPDTINKTARSYLSEKNRKLVDSSSVPVLLPNDPELLKNGEMIVTTYWYSFSSDIGKLHYTVDGDRVAHNFPDFPVLPATNTVRNNRESIFSRTETGQMGTWNEGGAVYTFGLDCDDLNDLNCKTKNLVLKLVQNAVYVGGLGKE